MGIKKVALTSVFKWLGNSSTGVRKTMGVFLYYVSFIVIRRRFHIVRRNLETCFPEADKAQIDVWVKEHFRALTQSVIDRAVLWYGPTSAINEMLEVEGFEHIQNRLDQGSPIIMLAPHFISLDASGTAVTMRLKKTASMYTTQGDPDVDAIVKTGRARFNEVFLISRKEGIRGIMRHLKEGTPIYYLPDMDFGAKGSIFSPFFNVPAATLITTAQIAKNWNAVIVPVISYWNPTTGKYKTTILPELENFPGDRTIEEATADLNLLIEQWIRKEPSQYYWVHKRFKTRPEGEPSIY